MLVNRNAVYFFLVMIIYQTNLFNPLINFIIIYRFLWGVIWKKYFLGIMTDCLPFSILITIIFLLFCFGLFFVKTVNYTTCSQHCGILLSSNFSFLVLHHVFYVTVLLLRVGKHETKSHESMAYNKYLKIIFCPLLHTCTEKAKYLFQV